MEKQGKAFRKQLTQYQMDFGFLQAVDCSREECREFTQRLDQGQELPNSVFQRELIYNGDRVESFYRIQKTDLSESERMEYLLYRQLKLLKTIKKIAVVFLVFLVLFVLFPTCIAILSGI